MQGNIVVGGRVYRVVDFAPSVPAVFKAGIRPGLTFTGLIPLEAVNVLDPLGQTMDLGAFLGLAMSRDYVLILAQKA